MALTAGPACADEPAPGTIQSEAFAARSGPRGATLFTLLPPEQTGVTSINTYSDPRMWAEAYSEFAFGSLGSGVAIADYDGDGRADIFIVNKSDPVRLYRNLGGMHFEDVTEAAGIKDPNDAWKQGATFADVNNDGHLDLYICRFNAPNLLYLNQGNGTFVEGAKGAGLALVDSSVMAAFCDYDRDGWLDVYITTNLLDQQHRPQGQRDHLFHNHGDGTFSEVSKPAGLYGEKQSHSATWWDFNNDGWPDVYVANDFNAPDQVYLNNGDGTFSDMLSRTAPHIPYFSMGTDFGDVNNDGLIDFFVADMAPTSREDNLRGMLNMRAHIARDLPSPEVAPQYMQNALLLNTDTPRFQEAARLAGIAATDWTWSVRLEDFDEDGRVDLHVTNGTVRNFFDSDLLTRKATLGQPESDALVKNAPVLREQNLAFRNRGTLDFENVSAAWGLAQQGVSFGAATGDLDGDGDLDLVIANYQAAPTVLRNDANGPHHLIVALRGTASNRFGIGATVSLETKSGHQVRSLSLARGYLSSSEPILHFGLGDDEQVLRLKIMWPSGREQTLENMAADRRYEITEPEGPAYSPPPAIRQWRPDPSAQFEEVSASSGLAWVSRESPFDEFSQQRLLPFRHQAFGPALAVADVNNDGADDVLVGASAGEGIQLFFSAGAGQYSRGGNGALTAAHPVASAALLVVDFNGDENPDLLVTRGGVNAPADAEAYQPLLLLGQGLGLFAAAPEGSLPKMPISAGAAAAADFNHDGRPDLFIGGRIAPGGYPSAPRSALLVNRDGKFEDVTEQLAAGLGRAGMVTSALWTDVNQDGWPDLIIALEWGGVRCWVNHNGTRFDEVSEQLGFASAGSGWWTSLTAADFNGDGHVDYAVGNMGLNTSYAASPEKPAVLLQGDFDDSGRRHLIEATVEGDRLMPRRGRNQVSAAMPWLGRKFPSFAGYASASIEDLFGAGRIAAATRFNLTELRCGVLLSQPDGTFRFSPLPRIAQIAPAFGLAAGDFDGDGKADLYLLQNSFSPIPETGRFDGGLSQLLLGDGRGGFTEVAPRASGLIVPADAKSLAIADLDSDGWPDFIVSRNNNTGLVFHNRGAAGRHSVRVMLRPPPGISPAGARARLVLSDGSSQTAEVYCGSGYLTQSSSSLFFGYAGEARPQELRVTWPDGAHSTHAWAGQAQGWIVSQP